jgi:hypothetical protein
MMIRRLRPALLALALLLTVAALNVPIQASECEEGDFEWMNLGDCCSQFYPPPGKVHPMRCVNGEWTLFSNAYRCPPTEPCG